MNEYGVPNRVKYAILAVLVVGLVGARLFGEHDTPLELPTGDAQSAGGPTTPSAADVKQLTKLDVKLGTGPAAKAGDSVDMLYTGKLDDGTVFDSTSKNHDKPFNFTLGAGRVIPGWDLGIVGMKVGGKRTLIIPPALGYGSQAQASIPANSRLTFDVELLKIEKPGAPQQPPLPLPTLLPTGGAGGTTPVPHRKG